MEDTKVTKFTIRCYKNDNIFVIATAASHALDMIGQGSKINTMQNEVWKSGDYFSALEVIKKYVNIEYVEDDQE